MANCYLCDELITVQNCSNEHIIPNSIGGKLTSKGLICKVCNDTTGGLFDAEFAKVGNFLASKYQIKRDRGEVPTFDATEIESGKTLLVEPGFKTSYKDPISDSDKKRIWVQHHDKNRVLQELRRIAKSIGDPEPNAEDIVIELKPVEPSKKLDFLFDRSLEPTLFLRSVCKTIINLYLFQTEDYSNVQSLIRFLLEDIENRFCWFLDLKVCKEYHQTPHHLIVIRGEKKSKILYSYYEIFGEMGFITLMNGRYNEADLAINYTYDPLAGKEIITDYDFHLKAGSIISHLMEKPESEILKIIHGH
jgi:hypothetical protein